MEASISIAGGISSYSRGVLRRAKYELKRPINWRDEAHTLTHLGLRQLLAWCAPGTSNLTEFESKRFQ